MSNIEIIDRTKPQMNVNEEYDNLIKEFKEYTKANFFMEFNCVKYLEPNGKYLPPFNPERFNEDVEYDKTKFDTPFSHMLYLAILLGKKLQQSDSEFALSQLAKGEAIYTPEL